MEFRILGPVEVVSDGRVVSVRQAMCPETGEPKALPPKLFYDAAGAALFEQIDPADSGRSGNRTTTSDPGRGLAP